jgi:hypothetical protein
MAMPEVLRQVRWNWDKIVFADTKEKTKQNKTKKTINP